MEIITLINLFCMLNGFQPLSNADPYLLCLSHFVLQSYNVLFVLCSSVFPVIQMRQNRGNPEKNNLYLLACVYLNSSSILITTC